MHRAGVETGCAVQNMVLAGNIEQGRVRDHRANIMSDGSNHDYSGWMQRSSHLSGLFFFFSFLSVLLFFSFNFPYEWETPW